MVMINKMSTAFVEMKLGAFCNVLGAVGGANPRLAVVWI